MCIKYIAILQYRFVSLGQPCKFQVVSRLGSVTARQSSSGRQPNFAALNRGRHLYSTGRPSRWALAHISSFSIHFRAAQSPTATLCDFLSKHICSVYYFVVLHATSNSRVVLCLPPSHWILATPLPLSTVAYRWIRRFNEPGPPTSSLSSRAPRDIE